MAITRRIEIGMWVTLALLASVYAWHRYTFQDRYIAALEQDGYIVNRVVGTSCVIVDARDRDGDETTAWACSR